MGGEYKLVLATQYFFCQCIPISWVSSADTSPGVEVSIYHDLVWVSAVPLCLEWAILCSSEVISLLLSGRVGWWAFVIFHRAAAFFLNKGLGLSQQAILHLGIGGVPKAKFRKWGLTCCACCHLSSPYLLPLLLHIHPRQMAVLRLRYYKNVSWQGAISSV